jgi:hypothetical protein
VCFELSFHNTGTQCLGFIDLSQSVNFTIR